MPARVKGGLPVAWDRVRKMLPFLILFLIAAAVLSAAGSTGTAEDMEAMSEINGMIWLMIKWTRIAIVAVSVIIFVASLIGEFGNRNGPDYPAVMNRLLTAAIVSGLAFGVGDLIMMVYGAEISTVFL